MLRGSGTADRFATRWFPDEIPMTVELAKTDEFALGGLLVEPALRTVSAGEASVTLEPRVMQVLVLLSHRAGEPVDRDTMIEQCWSGVIVGEDAIQRCIGRLRRLASELGGFEIQTIPKVGYRLLANGDSPPAPSIQPETAPAPPRLAFAKALYRGSGDNGGDFAQLLVSDVAAALSVNRDLAVIAPGAGGETDYTVTVEVRSQANVARIHCSLTQASSGRIVWTDAIDVAEGTSAIASGIPSDNLVIDLAGRIGAVVIGDVTQSSLAEPKAQSSWQAVVRANAAYQRIDLENLAAAIDEGHRAVSLDPTYGAAHAALANALAAHFELGGGLDESECDEARSACNMALALAPEDATVLAWTAHALLMITRPAEGLPLAEKAVELAPSHWIANLYLARHYLHHGRPEDAEHALDDHARVAPLFPWKYFPILTRGLARFMQGDIEGAERLMREASMLNPIYPYSWMSLMILGALKQDDGLMSDSAAQLKQLDGEGSLDLQLARIAHSYPDPAQAAMLQNAFKTAWEA